jgi:hypothetical protein
VNIKQSYDGYCLIRENIAENKAWLEGNPYNYSWLKNLAAAYSELNRTDSAALDMEKALDNSLFTLSVLVEPQYKNLRNHPSWPGLKSRVIDTWKSYYPEGNAAFATELEAMEYHDQRVRAEQEEAIATFGRGTDEVYKAQLESIRIDSLNRQKLDSLLEVHGWPTQAMIGQSGMGTIWLTVQHADYAFQKKYLPDIKLAVKKRRFGTCTTRLSSRPHVNERRQKTDLWQPA